MSNERKPTYVVVKRCTECHGLTLFWPGEAREQCDCGSSFHVEDGTVPLAMPYHLTRFTGRALAGDLTAEARVRGGEPDSPKQGDP